MLEDLTGEEYADWMEVLTVEPFGSFKNPLEWAFPETREKRWMAYRLRGEGRTLDEFVAESMSQPALNLKGGIPNGMVSKSLESALEGFMSRVKSQKGRDPTSSGNSGPIKI